MGSLRSDLRFAVRALLARPGLSALAILTLAIGIGVNAVAFTAISSLLYKPTTFPEFETLGWIGTREPGNTYGLTSSPNYQDIARAARTFEGIGASGRVPLGFREGNASRQIWSQVVSLNYFSLLRARPALGRLFAESDLQSSEVPAVVSQSFWNESLGGGTSVAGRSMVVNGRTAAIVGVLPDDFQGPGGLFDPDVWVPLERMEALNLPSRLSSRTEAWLGLFGRLAPGIGPAQGAADLQGIGAALAEAHPVINRNRALTFTWMPDGNPELQRLAPTAYLALAIVSVVLLIACFNVAGLLLARAAERQREISVRAALGASRGRIVRQFAVEGLILAALSGTAAVIVATWSADLLSVFSLPAPIPQRIHMDVDRRLIAFIAAMVALGGVLPALLPAFQSTRADLMRSMRLETTLGQPRSRARSAFVIAQVAGSTLFLAIALLFVRSFVQDSVRSPGFETRHLLVLEIKPSDYGYDAARARVFFDALVDRLQTHPGVSQAAIADRVSFYVGFPKVTPVSIDGTDCSTADCRKVTPYTVSAGYFAALGVPLLSGRDFTAQDVKSGDGVIVGQTLASRLWPGRNAVGEWIREGRDGRQRQVIGVAADVIHRGFGEAPADYIYRPIAEAEYADSVTLLVRTTAESRLFAGTVREQMRALDPDLPPGSVKTMEQRMELPLWPLRTAAGFFAVCGSLALVLAMVGLFGTTYLAVSQRTREFGIRTALGATSRRVMNLVIGEGFRLTIPGIALGLTGALIVGRILASSFFKLTAVDPAVLATAAVLQALVTLAACLLPAYRATKADPIVALRQE